MRQRAVGPSQHSCRLAPWPRLRPWLTFLLLILHRQSCRLCSYLLYCQLVTEFHECVRQQCKSHTALSPPRTPATASTLAYIPATHPTRKIMPAIGCLVDCQLGTDIHESERQRAAGPAQHSRRLALRMWRQTLTLTLAYMPATHPTRTASLNIFLVSLSTSS